MVRIIQEASDKLLVYAVANRPIDKVELYAKAGDTREFIGSAEERNAFAFLIQTPRESKPFEPSRHRYIVVMYGDGAKVGEEEAIATNFAIPAWKRGIAKVRRKEFLAVAKNVNGTKILVFKKTAGRKCPECYDEDLDASINTSCARCGGTGFVDEYTQPHFTWGMAFLRQPPSHRLGEPTGKDIHKPSSRDTGRVVVLNEIPIEVDDLVYVVDAGELGLVRSITRTQFSGIDLTQAVDMNILPSGSREFQAVEPMLIEKLGEVYALNRR